MDKINQPTKEQVRQYLAQRRMANHPPPPMSEIRRLLGWELVRTSSQPARQTA